MKTDGEKRESKRLYDAARYANDPEKYRKISSDWKKRNPEKVREQKNKWRAKNRDKFLSYYATYRENHREKIRCYRKNNKSQILDYCRQWQNDNPGKVKGYRQKYKDNHPERIREIYRKYREAHPDKLRQFNSAARARRRNSPGRGVTKTDILLQLKGQANRCWWCRKKIVNNQYDIDHRIALSVGGEHDPSNIVISCPSCNRKKHTKTPAEFCGRLL